MRPCTRFSLAVTCVVLILALAACAGGAAPAPAQPTSSSAPAAQPTAIAVAAQPTAASTESTAPANTSEPTTAAAQPAAATPAGQVTSGGKLVFGLSNEPETLDPLVGSSYEGAAIDGAVFDTLVRETPDGKFHPGLATKWEISPDGLTYTFHLRQDVKFHDGTPFNAAAVKFTFDRIVNPATKSEQSIALVGTYTSTEVIDDFTAKIHLTAPYGPFLSGIAQPNVSIVSPTAVKKYGDTFTDHLVGTGPFIFKEWVRSDHVTLVRNPDYNWASDYFTHQGPAYLDEIDFKFIPEATVRSGTLQTGETNMINDVPPEDFGQLAADPNYKTYNIIQPGTPLAIAMNVTKPPLDDLKVRQALEYGIDKKAIVDTLFAGQYGLAYSPLAPNTLGYWSGSEQMYPYDQAKAKSLLDDAGWKAGPDGMRSKDGQPLKLEWPTFTWQNMDKMAQIVQAQLKDLGIDLTIDVGAFPAMYAKANKCEHNLVHTGNTDVDPNALDIVYDSSDVGNGWAWTCIKDAQIDQWLAQGRETTDPTARFPIYQKLQQRIPGSGSGGTDPPIQQPHCHAGGSEGAQFRARRLR